MTFATATIDRTQSAIANIEAQIAQLQEKLTSLQEQQQTIKSAEQQGLSAIHQYKQAIAAIAQLNEPEILQSFLGEMATITNDAIGDRPRLPEAPDETDDDDIVESPSNSPSSPTPPDVIVEAVDSNHLNNEAETDDADNDNLPDNDNTDNNHSDKEWTVAEEQQVTKHKRIRLVQFCSTHSVKFQPRDTKAVIVQRIKTENHDASYVIEWLGRSHRLL